jgi:hypothetical protein
VGGLWGDITLPGSRIGIAVSDILIWLPSAKMSFVTWGPSYSYARARCYRVQAKAKANPSACQHRRHAAVSNSHEKQGGS